MFDEETRSQEFMAIFTVFSRRYIFYIKYNPRCSEEKHFPFIQVRI